MNSEPKKQVSGESEDESCSRRKQQHQIEELQRKVQQMEERFGKMEEFLSKVVKRVLPKVEELLASQSPPANYPPSPSGKPKKESLGSEEEFGLQELERKQRQQMEELIRKQRQMEEEQQRKMQQMEKILSKVEELLARQSLPSTSAPQAEPSTSSIHTFTPTATPSSSVPSTTTTAQSLHEAAERGDTQSLLRMLAEGKYVDARDTSGNTALHVAAQRGHVAAVEALVEGGARVDVRRATRSRPLHLAAAEGHVHVVRRLVEMGAAVIHIDDHKTPLMIAAARGQTAVLEVLLQSSVGPEELERCLEDAGNADVVKVLLNDARLSLGEDVARRAVEEAARNGRLSALDALLQKGFRSRTALHRAASGGHADCLQVLLEAGADVNVVDGEIWTPLHWAALNGQTQCVRLLLDAGADVNFPSEWGTPLKVAQDYERDDTARLLREKGGRYM